MQHSFRHELAAGDRVNVSRPILGAENPFLP
jgi:hypothetical protein